jgi:hypothetical protein
VRLFYSPHSPGITDCDVLVFMEASYRQMLPAGKRDRRSALQFLEAFLIRFPRVIWFDDHDSSGMLRSYIFPLVQLYAKAQLLTDKSYYTGEHHTGVLHRDYVHERHEVADGKLFKGPLEQEDLNKLRLSWNLAMVDWAAWLRPGILNRMRHYFPSREYKVQTVAPNLEKRPVQVAYRVGMHRHVPTVHWWRQRTKELIEEFSRIHPSLHVNCEGYLPAREYLREMQNAVVTPSPFGVGEICYRDFESFMSGSLLLKPRMDHLETWPALYVDGETYVAFEWDFSDFQHKLECVLSDVRKYEGVAREGQRRFLQALSDGDAFAGWFQSMISP